MRDKRELGPIEIGMLGLKETPSAIDSNKIRRGRTVSDGGLLIPPAGGIYLKDVNPDERSFMSSINSISGNDGAGIKIVNTRMWQRDIPISGNTINNNAVAGIVLIKASPSVGHNNLADNRRMGIGMIESRSEVFYNIILRGQDAQIAVGDGSAPTIDSNKIDGENFASWGVYVTKGGAPTRIYLCNITRHRKFGVQKIDGPVINARENWWGDPSGPSHKSNTFGKGDRVSDNVDFSDWEPQPLRIRD